MLARSAGAGLRARRPSGLVFNAIRDVRQKSSANDKRPRVVPTAPIKSAPSPQRKPPQYGFPEYPTLMNKVGATAKASETSTSQPSEYSGRQEEFRTEARPIADQTPSTVTEAAPLGSSPEPSHAYPEAPDVAPHSVSAANEGPEALFNSTGSPQSQSERAPLPDLTQGIPSSFDFKGSSSASGTESGGSDDGRSGILDVTSAASGGKGGGELPKSAYISSLDRRRNRIANFAFATFLLFSATGALFLGRNWESEEEEQRHSDAPSGWGLRLFYNRVRARLSDKMGYYTEPAFPKLLPDVDPAFERPFTLVLSLDDLLVHSEWSREHGWRTAKRPGVDYFLRYLQQYYELVIFTSAPVAMAEPLLRKLDPYRIVMWPLFREATKYVDGKHVKDLSYLNRDLSKVILIDTDPSHAMLQPENAIILPKWKGDPKDRELVSLIPFLEYVATMGLTDTRTVLKSFENKHIPTEFAAREAIARRKFEEEMAKERAQRSRRLGKGLMTTIMGGRSGAGLDGFEQTAAEAFEQGKMLQDHIRERGQKQYEALEKEIRENGEKWLKEMAAEDEKFREEQMKGMRSSLAGFIGSLGQPPADRK